MMNDEDDEWLEGGSTRDKIGEAGAKGRDVTKSELSKLIGLTLPTIEKAIREGAPVQSRGAGREGWRVNTAAFFGWYWRHKVAKATASADLDDAKLRDKEAQARLRELNIAQKEGSLIPLDEVTAFIGAKFGVVRSRFLSVETQVLGLTDDQREQLHNAIIDALTDVSTDPMEDWTNGAVADDGDSESA